VTLKTGIDEIALTRGHGKFVAVISTHDEQDRVPIRTVLPDRLKGGTVKWAFETAVPRAAVR
jgi:hypothetical protein